MVVASDCSVEFAIGLQLNHVKSSPAAWGTVTCTWGSVTCTWGTVTCTWGTVTCTWGTVTCTWGTVTCTWGTVTCTWGLSIRGALLPVRGGYLYVGHYYLYVVARGQVAYCARGVHLRQRVFARPQNLLQLPEKRLLDDVLLKLIRPHPCLNHDTFFSPQIRARFPTTIHTLAKQMHVI